MVDIGDQEIVAKVGYSWEDSCEDNLVTIDDEDIGFVHADDIFFMIEGA
jgi:hypothetical protein